MIANNGLGNIVTDALGLQLPDISQYAPSFTVDWANKLEEKYGPIGATVIGLFGVWLLVKK